MGTVDEPAGVCVRPAGVYLSREVTTAAQPGASDPGRCLPGEPPHAPKCPQVDAARAVLPPRRAGRQPSTAPLYRHRQPAGRFLNSSQSDPGTPGGGKDLSPHVPAWPSMHTIPGVRGSGTALSAPPPAGGPGTSPTVGGWLGPRPAPSPTLTAAGRGVPAIYPGRIRSLMPTARRRFSSMARAPAWPEVACGALTGPRTPQAPQPRDARAATTTSDASRSPVTARGHWSG